MEQLSNLKGFPATKESHKSDNDYSYLWDQMCKQNGFTLMNNLGVGTYGTVKQVQCNQTKDEYAIKLVKRPFKSVYHAR